MPFSVTGFVHDLVRPFAKEGSVAVDLTCGNGFDCLFLCGCVGSSGLVFGFDVQEVAISRTKERLIHNGMDNFALFCDCHSNLDCYDIPPVCCAMMNLGYLPYGDKSVVTLGSTSVAAISKVLSLLTLGGVLSVVCYYGHDGGILELNAVSDFLRGLSFREFVVKRIELFNGSNCPPIVFLIERALPAF